MIFTNLIQTNLRTHQLGKNIEYYQRLSSTNSEAWHLIKTGQANHGMIVITDDQFNGRGQNGNSWFMGPSKGLAMSIILLEPLKLKNATLVPIMAGVAVAKTLSNRGGMPKLKWPNDILLGGKKCGGILCESKTSNQMVKKMIVGIGLNINESINEFPESLEHTATSLSIETGHPNQRELVCAIITTYFEQLIDDSDSSIKEWIGYCAHLEKMVTFNYKGRKYTGRFKGINNLGEALIDIDNEQRIFPSIILE